MIRGAILGHETALLTTIDAEARLLHRRLGHVSSGTLQRIQEVTTGLKNPIPVLKEPCEPCTLAKTVRVIN